MIRPPKTAIGRGAAIASIVVAASATTTALSSTAYGDAGATAVDATVAQQQSIAVRPGIPIMTERSAPDGGGSSCTLAFLYTDGKDTYAVTEGHCYANTPDIGIGFLHYRGASANPKENVGPIDKNLDAVYINHPCARSLPPRLTGTNCYNESDRIGSFVYALNNPFPDEGGLPGTPLGRNNPNLPENGDFGLIRLNDEVAYSPAMCLYGGPESEYQHPANPNALSTPEPVYIYSQGGLLGRNFATQTPIAPGSPGLAFPSDPANPWTGTYTHTEAHAFEPAQSGGPIMTTDGRAFGVMGGIHYLDRLGPNIARAEHYLNKDLRLLTARLLADAPPVGTDPACTPPVAAADGAS